MTRQATTAQVPEKKRNIPDYLIRDEIDGELFYYRGYQDVLNNKKTAEEIMACSGLQAWFITFFMGVYFKKLDQNRYYPLAGEVGNHLSKKNNLGLDFALFETSVLTADKINTHFVDVPPVVSIEIDTQVDTNQLADMDYVHKKVKKLLNSGVQKVLWIFTLTQRVLIAPQGQDWLNVDWNRDIELLDGYTFNIGKALAEAGINPDA